MGEQSHITAPRIGQVDDADRRVREVGLHQKRSLLVVGWQCQMTRPVTCQREILNFGRQAVLSNADVERDLIDEAENGNDLVIVWFLPKKHTDRLLQRLFP